MSLKQPLFVSLIILIYFFGGACDKESDPVSTAHKTYDTPYGTVTQIDDYPLYTLDYTSDYRFDEYLQTGNIPFNGLGNVNSGNYHCTCFAAFGGDNRLLGRNYDWPEVTSYYVVTTRPPNGYSSVSTVDMTFFDYQHDESPDSDANLDMLHTLPYFPFDGMNEKGVAVGMNAIPGARSPFDPFKVTIGELQLIRLVLDKASSTREALTLIRQYNIRMETPPIHYLIADSSGQSVIVEFVEGRMETIENPDPWQVSTNFIITGLTNPQNAPCWRYLTAYEILSSSNGLLSGVEAWQLLQNVSVSSTRWSTVFNLRNAQVQIAMGRDYENLHFFIVP